MHSRALVPLACLCIQLVAGPALAQIPGLPSTAPAPPPAAADPLGRDTPRGTIQGFNRAVTRNDLVAAASYLQLSDDQRDNADELARDLTELMDRYFTEALLSISDTPAGSLVDGLPPNRERVATLKTGTATLDVELVHVTSREGVPVWLFSRETLRQVPGASRSMEATWFERVMPKRLRETSFAGVSLARWIVLAASVAIPYLLLWFVSFVVIGVMRRAVTDPVRRKLFETWQAGLRVPIIVMATILANLAFVPVLVFPLRFRFLYSRAALVVAALAVTWLIWRLSALSFEHARIIARRRHESGLTSLLMLAERVVKVLITLVAIFLFLTIVGVDTTTALAGLGIGGVAVALGAQKTVENLLGGVFLLSDKALAVGDTCRIQNRVGVVEDITLRSVRLRTVEQSLVSVPAGVLSQESVENFATRGMILVQSTLRLRYGTTADQIAFVLQRIRALLAEHPDVQTETSRIRLVDFGVRAIDLELFAYIMTTDYSRFLEVREELLLKIAGIVESAGSGFAQPSDFNTPGRETRPNDEVHAVTRSAE